MSRSAKRIAARNSRDRTAKQLSGPNYVIMAIVTLAMVLSSFGWVLSAGGKAGMVVFAIVCALFFGAVGFVWYRRQKEVR